jgi:predicted O-methyltransferase YrrM
MNFVNEYIKYLCKSKGRHGIHSPFVYDFVDKCLAIKLPQDFKTSLHALQKSLRADQTLIEVTDAGVGSKKLTTKRSIQKIHQTATCKGVYANLLWQIAAHYQPTSILEFGTSLGIGTIHLAAGYPTATVVSVDACIETLKVARKNFKQFEISNVEIINDTFENYINGLKLASFDVVYIDGHHAGNALLNYLEKLRPFTHDETLFVLDDIRWSDDMFEAWNQLKTMEEYHLTMDLFRLGIIVRRAHQEKEHFVIKLNGVLSGF